MEAGGGDMGHHQAKAKGWKNTFLLAYGALGIIYGDLATSPLYTISSTLAESEDGGPAKDDSAATKGDITGVVCLIFWTMTLIVLIKYVLIVLRADDNGEGGTFALYSLLCRSLGITPMGQQLGEADKNLSRFSTRPADTTNQEVTSLLKLNSGAGTSAAAPEYRSLNGGLRRWFQSSKAAQMVLLFVVVLATSMVVGDGVLTPAITTLSAVNGLTVAPGIVVSQSAVLGLTSLILVLLFAGQQYGTSLVGAAFAPIIIAWLGLNAGVGITNLAIYGGEIFKALNPAEIVYFFQSHGWTGWRMLGGIMLSITGCEALFADLGHFNRQSVQVSFVTFVYPCLVLSYLGQGAYLLVHPDKVAKAFWASLPQPVFWPMWIVSILASVVGSQALISGAFSIIRQAIALGMLPKMHIIHTGTKVEGQIYIPAVNWTLMVCCIAVACGFGDPNQLGHAYGVAVMSVITITTLLTSLVMLIAWNTHLAWVVLYLVLYLPIELAFLSSTLNKIPSGGWVALVVAAIVSCMNWIWWWGGRVKIEHSRSKKTPLWKVLVQRPADHKDDGTTPLLARTPDGTSHADLVKLPTLTLPNGEKVKRMKGIGLYYTPAPSGVPPVLQHVLANSPAVYQTMVLLSTKIVPLPTVDLGERFLVKPEPSFDGVFRVLVRYGYRDRVDHGPAFAQQLVLVIVQHILDHHGIGGAGAAELLMGALPTPDSTLDALVASVQLLPEVEDKLMAASSAAAAPAAASGSPKHAGAGGVVASVAIKRQSDAAVSSSSTNTTTPAPGNAGAGTGNGAAAPPAAAAAANAPAPALPRGGRELGRVSKRSLGIGAAAASAAAEAGFPSSTGGRWYQPEVATIREMDLARTTSGGASTGAGGISSIGSTELVPSSRVAVDAAEVAEAGGSQYVVAGAVSGPAVSLLQVDQIQQELARLSRQDVVWELTATELAALLQAAEVVRAYRTRQVHLLGHTTLTVKPSRNIFRQLILGKLYFLLDAVQHEVTSAWNIPASQTIELGMEIEV